MFTDRMQSKNLVRGHAVRWTVKRLFQADVAEAGLSPQAEAMLERVLENVR